MTPSARNGHLAMLLFSMLVSVSFVLGERVAQDISPYVLNASRFIIASLIIGAVLLARYGAPHWPSPRAMLRFLGMGGLMGAYFALMFAALARTSSINTAAIFTTLPLLCGLLDWLINGRLLAPRAWAAVSIGACGALVVITRGDFSRLAGLGPQSGEALFFLGCVSHAFYVALTPRANQGLSAAHFTFGVVTGGAAALMIIGAGDFIRTDWAALPPLVWWTTAYLGVFATAATFLLMRVASLSLPAANVTAYTYLTPIWVMLMEIALGARPPLWALLGVIPVIVALIMLLRLRRNS